MKWTEITVHTTTFGSELVSDIFFDMGASGVVVADRKDILDTLQDKRMWDYADDDLLSSCGEVALVKAFVTADILADTMRKLSDNLSGLKEREQSEFSVGSLEIITREIDDEDWINIWKKHYKPIPVRNVVICPEWMDYRETDGQRTVKIDPGMAFGTGEHETTSMCVELMQELCLRGKRVLDVGCGSGILAVTALLLGAERAALVDFDPQAVSAAKKNASLNGVLERCDIFEGDLLGNVKDGADVIFANITADILLRLGKDIKPYVKSGGHVILSGLIHKRADEVIDFYRSLGFKLLKKLSRGEWNAALFEI